jgi:hypothetical protein
VEDWVVDLAAGLAAAPLVVMVSTAALVSGVSKVDVAVRTATGGLVANRAEHRAAPALLVDWAGYQRLSRVPRTDETLR